MFKFKSKKEKYSDNKFKKGSNLQLIRVESAEDFIKKVNNIKPNEILVHEMDLIDSIRLNVRHPKYRDFIESRKIINLPGKNVKLCSYGKLTELLYKSEL